VKKKKQHEKNSTAVSGVLQFGRRYVNEEDNLNALFCPVQSKNKAIRKSFIKALVLDSVVFVLIL